MEGSIQNLPMQDQPRRPGGFLLDQPKSWVNTHTHTQPTSAGGANPKSAETRAQPSLHVGAGAFTTEEAPSDVKAETAVEADGFGLSGNL